MQVIIKDSCNEIYDIEYGYFEYPNLMELIVNTFYSEIGECKGRGLCGTCVVEIVDGNKNIAMDELEKYTLQVNEKEENHRLACQLLLDENINGSTFKIVD